MKLELEQFRDKLYNNEEHYVELQSLRLKKTKMCRVSCLKKALNSRHVKFFLEPDKISCTALKLNGHYL